MKLAMNVIAAVLILAGFYAIGGWAQHVLDTSDVRHHGP